MERLPFTSQDFPPTCDPNLAKGGTSGELCGQARRCKNYCVKAGKLPNKHTLCGSCHDIAMAKHVNSSEMHTIYKFH